MTLPTRKRHGRIEQWHSICSKHQTHDNLCNLCQVGGWFAIDNEDSDEDSDTK